MTAYHLIPDCLCDTSQPFSNHQSAGRSGHLGHALVEYNSGQLLAFYSNCSGVRDGGHTGYGWVEYRRSTDGGESWSAPEKLPYAWDAFLDGEHYVACEKAISTSPDHILLFCLRCVCKTGWEPYLEPVMLKSSDGGRTWSAPEILCGVRGRLWDALIRERKIFLLMFENDLSVPRSDPSRAEDTFRVYVSEDGGARFTPRTSIPYRSRQRTYGDLEWLPDGSLIAYVYDFDDEAHLEYCISKDEGVTWEPSGRVYLAKRIRNHQIARLNGLYYMAGRSGNGGGESKFVLYTSADGLHWDEGRYIRQAREGAYGSHAFYSNLLTTGQYGGKKRILVQYSDTYEKMRANVRHLWIEPDDGAAAQGQTESDGMVSK